MEIKASILANNGIAAFGRMKFSFVVALMLSAMTFICDDLFAQRYSISTNLVEWANLGTMNAEAGVAVAQHFSIHAGFRYNNWTFNKGNPEERFSDPIGESEQQLENRKQAYSIGVRYWPWYVYSGWWGYLRTQYMEYNRGGLIRHAAEEGDAYGAGVGIGYTRMLHRNWNIEFGIGMWSGFKSFTTYRCTNCGSIVDQGQKLFILPDDVFVALTFIF